MKNELNINEIRKDDKGAYFKIVATFDYKEGYIKDVFLKVNNGKREESFKLNYKEVKENIVYFEKEIYLETCALYKYFLEYKANDEIKYLKKDNTVVSEQLSEYEKSKLSVNFSVPSWAKGKIMYHIFIDRFNKSEKLEIDELKNRHIHKNWDEDIINVDENGVWNNYFYGGNLLGIEEKLDYIKSLGTEIIYLSPVVHSQSNHRYDTSDYENVDPYIGSNKDLKNLCEKAHESGIKIILDAVFNHTGNDSKYFNEYNNFNEIGAYQSKDSPYYNFFKKYCANEKVYFDYWWGMKNLPVCDGENEEWIKYITGKNGVIDKWYELGIDGLRLDVADELTDEFIEKINEACKRNNENSFILGEVWENPMRMNRDYIGSGKSMHSVMNYKLVDALIRYFKFEDTEKLRYTINDILSEYPDEMIQSLMNFTSTHDISRAINIFSSDLYHQNQQWVWDTGNENSNLLTDEEIKKGLEIYKTYILTLAMMPGNLSIFYGDETLVEGFGNLYNRKPFPWDKQNDNLIGFFKSIGELRKQENELETSDLKILEINKDYIIFERNNKAIKYLIAVNRTSEIKKIDLNEKNYFAKTIYEHNESSSAQLNPYGAIVRKLKK